MILRRGGVACLFVWLLVGCGSDADAEPPATTEAPRESATTSAPADPTDTAEAEEPGAPVQPDDFDESVDASADPEFNFTHKMMLSTGENPFAALGFECAECTFEQWLAIDPPEGWSKGPAQVVVPDRNELRSTPSFEGFPDSADFVAEVPGDEYEVIVKNLSVELVERGAGGVVARAQVMRDTLLGFSAGRRVHEITDPDGVVFVLIAWGIDPTDVVVPDFDDPDALGEVAVPEGWGYSSRIIEDDLWLDTTDTTTVVAIRGAVTSTWERRDH